MEARQRDEPQKHGQTNKNKIGKNQESIQLSTTLIRDTIWESDKTQGNITHKRG